MKVALVVMPFASVDRPSLAVGLLQAGLQNIGIDCDSKHFNITLWRMLGDEAFNALCSNTAMLPVAGEWIFSQCLFGQEYSDWESYEREVLDDPLWGMEPKDRWIVRAGLETCPHFLRLAFESTDWSQYDLVGFTSLFQQTIASLCLAKMIRDRFPEVRIALGGSNFQETMGRPYIEHLDYIDFVSSGEADFSFLKLCDNIRRHRLRGSVEPLEIPPGYLYRSDRGEVTGVPAEPGGVSNLDELPVPEFSDYFRVLRSTLGERLDRDGEPFLAWLPVESSRGCWWGQKAHCTFCGLNGQTMAFRSKKWDRVAAETDELWRRHGELPLQFTDNILSMGYFKDLLPHWAEHRPEINKFFEIKANLRQSQLALLRRAGVTSVQPGIESFADGTLELMDKGVSAAQNIAVLRWCTELGIRPLWNLLFGFPGEDLADWAQNFELSKKLTHLPGPEGYGVIRLDRFSPHFNRWREYGFTSFEALPGYRHAFGFAGESVSELAYFFRYEHPQLETAINTSIPLSTHCLEWRKQSEAATNGELALKPHWQGGHVLVDTRYNFPRRSESLGAVGCRLLEACDSPRLRANAIGWVTKRLPFELHHTIEPVLDDLIKHSVIAKAGARLITLALLPRSTEKPAAAEIGAEFFHYPKPDNTLAKGGESWTKRSENTY